MSLIRSYNPIWEFRDLVGKPLDNTYYFFTLQNTLPYLPSPIWQDSSGNVIWSDPIQLLANGTLPENLYFDDTQVYRLEWRAGPTQNDALIYLVENYIPGTGATPIPTTALSITDNQITNPQFADVNFNPAVGLVINTATTVEIAPGWSVTTSGTGSLTVNQVTYTGNTFATGNQTNASYGISLNNSGFSSVKLFQRFNGNGALWTGEFVCGNMTASCDTTANLTMKLNYSDATDFVTIFPAQALTVVQTDFVATAPTIPIISTSNLQPQNAWTELDLTFKTNNTVFITSVQLLGESSPLKLSYLQTTLERQKDQEFHYYNLPLQYKPIPSYLVGWDFPLNPAQFTNAGAIGPVSNGLTNASYYAWDQTILFQSIDNSLSVARDSHTNGFKISTSTPTRSAIVQYLPAAVAREILSQKNSVSLNAFIDGTGLANLSGTISLWWTTSTLPSLLTPTFVSLVSAVNANGVVVAGNGSWTQVINNNQLGSFSLTPVVGTNYYNGVTSINGFDATTTTASSTATFFALVVAFDTLPSTATITVNYVSLVGGDIATRPAPQTQDEVLRESQYYYETSKNFGALITSSTAGGALLSSMNFVNNGGTGAIDMWAKAFGFQFKTPKISTSSISTIYSPGGATGNVTGYIFNGTTTKGSSNVGITNWTASNLGNYGIHYLVNTNSALFAGGIAGTVDASTDAYILYHYTIDSRLGIV